MSSKPSIPKGTRDFLPETMVKRNYIFSTIKSVFEKYGFLPIETPSMENTETLMGKYGDEGDKLIFRILNSGEYLENYLGVLKRQLFLTLEDIQKKIYKSGSSDPESELDDYISFYNANSDFEPIPVLIYKEEILPKLRKELVSYTSEKENPTYTFTTFDFEEIAARVVRSLPLDIRLSGTLTKIISEKALRYDLTVPFARFVVQHQNELAFPFKRYQIQPVWRADRPQKGRYREFYQCDADVVGSDSLLYEIELVQIFDEVLSKLGFEDFSIKINNRKILSGIAEVCGEAEKLIAITVAIDKLDKIGIDGVIKELQERGVSDQAIKKINPLFSLTGSNEEKLSSLRTFLELSEVGLKGIEELSYVLSRANELGIQKANIEFDVTLARGLNYYTGAIFEVKANNVQMGSICGGGRYDDLTGLFGLKGLSGVGISFGADRIYDVMNELNLFPTAALTSTKVLFINFGETEQMHSLKIAKQLREKNIACEVYPSDAKMQKQMKYANDRKIPFVVMIGSKEIESNQVTFKNMESGAQQTAALDQLIKEISQ